MAQNDTGQARGGRAMSNVALLNVEIGPRQQHDDLGMAAIDFL
jgi:hypothetical protein